MFVQRHLRSSSVWHSYIALKFPVLLQADFGFAKPKEAPVLAPLLPRLTSYSQHEHEHAIFAARSVL